MKEYVKISRENYDKLVERANRIEKEWKFETVICLDVIQAFEKRGVTIKTDSEDIKKVIERLEDRLSEKNKENVINSLCIDNLGQENKGLLSELEDLRQESDDNLKKLKSMSIFQFIKLKLK